MSKIFSQKKIGSSLYLGVFLLYLKLLFIEPIFVMYGTDVTASLVLLLIVLIRVSFKITFLKIDVFGNNKSARFFWLYIFFSTLSSLVLSPEIASGVITVNVQLFLVYLLFIDLKSINIDSVRIEKVINALVYFALLNAILVVYTFFFGKIGLIGEVSEDVSGLTRAFGLMGDQVAWFLTFFALYSLYIKKRYHFLIFTLAILMGASLGATIVLVVSTVFFYVKNKKFKVSDFLKIGFSIVLFIFILISNSSIFNKIGLLQRFQEGDFAGTESHTTGHRFNAISNAIDEIQEKPLLGFQNYSLAMFKKYDIMLTNMEKGDLTFLTTPNNQILAIICDFGFIGLIFFIFFILGLIRITKMKCAKMPDKILAFKQSVTIWLIIFLIFNQSATWFLPSSYLWILICLIVSISYKINQLYGIEK